MFELLEKEVGLLNLILSDTSPLNVGLHIFGLIVKYNTTHRVDSVYHILISGVFAEVPGSDLYHTQQAVSKTEKFIPVTLCGFTMYCLQ